MNLMAGKFIVLDGGEGCGKSTQARLLATALNARGEGVLAVRDPGTTPLGERIRSILLDPESAGMAMRCEMLLYMAARAQMMRDVVLPALAQGKCVISDRFISSTLAYQLGGDGLTAADIYAVGEVAVAGRWPDLTIILDIGVEAFAHRVGQARDRIEQRPLAYHQKVRETYLKIARDMPDSYRVISADQSIEAVHQAIMETLSFL